MAENPINYNMPGNSNKAKDEAKQEAEKQKEVSKVVQGKAVERKPPLRKKIAATFAGDDAQSVGTYILFEVAIPALKLFITDAVNGGLERMLYGSTGSGKRTGYGRSSHTNYGSIFKSNGNDSKPREISNRARSTHDFNEIVIENREDAQEVINQMVERIQDYDVVSVSTLYSLVGIQGSFTDEKWGWSDLQDARIRRVREGFLLDLPRPEELD